MSSTSWDRVARMRAWQQFEAEDFLASDLEAVLTLAEMALNDGHDVD